MEQVNEDDSLDFKWLKKKGVGKNKEIQFYESFIYDGEEYKLYDCVYMYNGDTHRAYVGKLTKIWERQDNLKKKVKVHWFFLPEEISSWLKETKTVENEVFLASGGGRGLLNICPLEAIAGPCNVVCVSKDSRYSQPSDEEVKAADFIFSRTFDVDSCTISDKMDDKVGGLEIKYVFNRKKSSEKSNPSPGISDTKEETTNHINSSETQNISTKLVPNILKDAKGDPQENDVCNMSKRNAESDKAHVQPLKKIKSDDKFVESGVASGSEKMPPSTKSKVDRDKMQVSIVPAEKLENKERNAKSDKAHNQPSKKIESDDKCVESGVKASGSEKMPPSTKFKVVRDKMQVSIVPAEKLENKERNKTPTDSDKSHDQPLKRVKSDDENPLEEKSVQPKATQSMTDSKSKPEDNLKTSGTSDNNLITSGTSGKAENLRNGKISGKTADVEGKKLKRTRDDNSYKATDYKQQRVHMNEKDPVANSTLAIEKTKFGSLDSPKDINNSNTNNNNTEAKEEQSGEKENELSINKASKDKSGWFKQLPWEDKLMNAYNEGRAILLHDLKPDYTSEDVKSIISTYFQEECNDAKLLPRIAISSPHYDQALILLKTKEAAQRILTELDERCLMLPDERPLVATPCPPVSIVATPCAQVSTKKDFTFIGHLTINKARFQNQREDEAVSTSHFSQPNTIEYDMAMEWCCHYKKSEKWWTKLHKKQGIELKNLMKDLKQQQKQKQKTA